MTTIEDLHLRIERAERVEDDLRGRREHGLTLTEFGDYTVVDDGQDRWVALTEDLDDSTERIISTVCDGGFSEEDADMLADAYAKLCDLTDQIDLDDEDDTVVIDAGVLAELREFVLGEQWETVD